MMTQDNEQSAIEMMSIAAQRERQGQIQEATQLYGALSQVKFRYQDQAKHLYARGLIRTHRYDDGLGILEQLLKTHEKPTVFRANILRTVVWGNLLNDGTQRDAELALSEAFEIFKQQDDLEGQAGIYYLRGMISARQGNVTDAVQQFKSSTWVSQVGQVMSEPTITTEVPSRGSPSPIMV